MTTTLRQASKEEINRLISTGTCGSFSGDDLKKFQRCLQSTGSVWMGLVDEKLVCVWGLMPPTLLSDQAYLWLQIAESFDNYIFTFIRNSQLVIEQMLEQYPKIVGHGTVGQDRSIRWLRWLGAEFGEPQGELIPFVIRRRTE